MPDIPESYTDLINEVYSAGQWFQVPKDFFLIMDKELACTLAFLINKNRLESTKGTRTWFRCSVTEVDRNLVLSPGRQQKLLAKLKRMELLTVKMKGLPAKRFLSIDYELLRSMVLNARRELEKEADLDSGG